MCCRLLDQKPFCLGAWRQHPSVFYYSGCLFPLWMICFFLFSTWKLLGSFFINVLKVLADITEGFLLTYFPWDSLRFLNLQFFFNPGKCPIVYLENFLYHFLCPVSLGLTGWPLDLCISFLFTHDLPFFIVLYILWTLSLSSSSIFSNYNFIPKILFCSLFLLSWHSVLMDELSIYQYQFKCW